MEVFHLFSYFIKNGWILSTHFMHMKFLGGAVFWDWAIFDNYSCQFRCLPELLALERSTLFIVFAEKGGGTPPFYLFSLDLGGRVPPFPADSRKKVDAAIRI